MPTTDQILKGHAQALEENRKNALRCGQFLAMKFGETWYVEKRDENNVYRGSFYISDDEVSDLDGLVIQLRIRMAQAGLDELTSKHDCSEGIPERREG